MPWQDIVISIAGWAGALALIPTILSKDKPALWSCILTTCTVVIITFCYITLGLWASASSAGVVAILWFIMAVQKWRIDRMVK